MPQYYYEDIDNVRRNKVTVVGDTSLVYNTVLSATFSNEATHPFTLAEVRNWCLIDNSDFDSVLTLLIPAARRELEKKYNKSFVERTVAAKVLNDLGGLELPYGPVVSITSITDSKGETVVVNDYNFSTPSISGYLTFVYEAGYDVLPEDYKVMWLNKILEMFDKRSNVS